MVHYNIDPIKCFVREKYLYDLDLSKNDFLPCEIFSISSYIGHVLTCQILIDKKYIFSYIPLMALTTIKYAPELNINNCYYNNCPDNKITITKYNSINELFIYQKYKIIKGHYLFSIDWYNDNLNSHLINIDDGNFILWPSHKISLQPVFNLPKYKKLHKEFIL